MSSYPHLSPDVVEMVNASVDDRVRYIQKDRWIDYPGAKTIIGRLKDLVEYPDVERPPCMLIVARSNNGKTRLINHFLENNPADPNPGGETIKVPVLLVTAPIKPDLDTLSAAILEKLFISSKKRTYAKGEKYNQVIEVLSRIRPGVLAIDEFNNMLAGPITNQKQLLNGIKNIGTLTRRPVVALGTEDAVRVTQTDPQVSNRFEPVYLERWQANGDFQRLLFSMERLIPLAKPSNLALPLMARKIHDLTEGTIGELTALINRAAIWAIRSGNEQIDDTALSKCGYTPPSKRKQPKLPV